MTLATCKQCGQPVSNEASTCPGCGVPSPAVSREKELLQVEIDREREEERRQEGLYKQAQRDKFLWFGGGKVQRHVDLAREAGKRKLDLMRRLQDLDLPSEFRDDEPRG